MGTWRDNEGEAMKERRTLCNDEVLAHQEKVTILKVYVSNNRAANCVKQTLIELRVETDKSRIIVRDFITPFSTTQKSTQKISKDMDELINIINQ